MHITMKEQTTDGKPAIMCVEREIRTCIILNADPEKIDTFVTLANAMGVTQVYLLTDVHTAVQLVNTAGWVEPLMKVLLVKEKQ
jgi:hypothetical protein